MDNFLILCLKLIDIEDKLKLNGDNQTANELKNIRVGLEDIYKRGQK